MIIGVGVDSVEISRVQHSCERSHFTERIFTKEEIAQFDRRKVRAASDFAGKEAVVKVFGTGFAGCQPAEIEILRDDKGAPYVKLYGGARKIAEELGIKTIKISITNTSDTATAFAVGSDDGKEAGF
ncbi:MAG: holo-ACP synthase [Roseburia sp.]|nr:holo-ACP synthase [Roseburia sp.]